MEEEGKQSSFYEVGTNKQGGRKMNYCNPEGFRNEIKSMRDKGKDVFFNWFDGPKEGSVDEVFEKAEDVFTRLMLPSAKKYLKKLNKKTSLDIGYGSGGQVLAASLYFDKAYGLDVHEEVDLVVEELVSRGAKKGEVELMIGNGLTIPLPDESIDFVHSWTTFMHLGTVENIKKYLEEIYRVMKPSGIGIVFFSRMLRSDRNQPWSEVLKDIKKEREIPGFREGGPKTKVRGINIQMAMWYMEDLAKGAGFELLSRTGSWDIINKRKYFFGQYGILFRKPSTSKSKSETTSSPESTSYVPRLKRRSGNK
jgi:ubiquinone/menaquinone biosynthesis C-methylase UbiE